MLQASVSPTFKQALQYIYLIISGQVRIYVKISHVFVSLFGVVTKQIQISLHCCLPSLPLSLLHSSAIHVRHMLRQIFHFYLTDSRVFCYQPPCPSCFHLAITSNTVGANILFQRRKEMIIYRRRISLMRM